MAGYIFQKVAGGGLRGASTVMDIQAAREWLRDLASDISSVNKSKIMRGKANLITKIDENFIGKLVMYYYDPKLKATLPFYDTFPLGMIVSFNAIGFLSLNLHYLSPYHRAILMDRLYNYINNDKLDATTRINITYQFLKGTSALRYYKPCLKQYLWNHIRSDFLAVPPEYWDFALMLPTARFQKKTKEFVWDDSENKIFGV